MHRVPEILQLPIIVERPRSPPFECQSSQERDLVPAGIPAEGSVPQEFGQSGLLLDGVIDLPFDEIQFFQVLRDKPAVQHDFHPEGRKVDIP